MRALAAAAFLASAPLLAQPPVLDPIEEVDAERPEAWLMAHTALLATPSSLGLGLLEPGAIDLGLELGSVPHLDREERTVGFGGLKEEHVNRSPVYARLRAAVGLPGGFALEAGYTPAVEVDGIDAELLSLALAHRLWSGADWELGARLGIQRGRVRGDLTCDGDDVAAGSPGSPGNPFGCEAPSADRFELEDLSLGLVLRRELARGSLYGELAWHRLDLEFQVDALTFGFRDRTLLLADTDAPSLALGATFAATERGVLAAELATAPLDVRRDPDGAVDREWTTNLRVIWRQRVRG